MKLRVAIFAGLLLAPLPAQAVGYRLRADALAQAQAPLGVLSLEGGSELLPGAEAEAWLWMSGGDLVSPEFDALVASLSYRDPEGRGVVRFGRFIETSGALPPVHMDGATVLGRLPWQGTAEFFAGLPVQPRFGARDFDWLVGGRLSQSAGPVTLGLAYYQRRDAGQLSDQELAIDSYSYLFGRLSVAARLSADLIRVGLSQGTLAFGLDLNRVRLELLAAQRSPSRLLPATSLFSVLGDQSLRQATGRVSWQLAPRLEVGANAGVRFFDDQPAEDFAINARLRLDAQGRGALGLELRRQGNLDGGWMGVRATARIWPLELLVLSTELELVRPDHGDANTGTLWPWGLVAVGLRPDPAWLLDVAGEASVTPTANSSFDLLLRVGYSPEVE